MTVAPVPDTESRPVPDLVVRRAIELIDSSGVLTQVETWSEAERRGPGGRPRTFPVRGLLVAMLLCAVGDEALLATNFTALLFGRISPAMRAELGVPDPPAGTDTLGWRNVYRNVRTRFHGLMALMDPSWAPKNLRLSDKLFKDMCELRKATLTEAQWTERGERLTWFVNALLEVSLKTLPRDIRRRWRGSIGVDATVVPAFARHDKRATRRRKAEHPAVIEHSADPDADWYVRGAVEPDTESGPSAKSVWGYEATFAVSGPDTDAEEDAIPSLVIGMAPLHKPGHEPGSNATRVLRSISTRSHPAGYLAADRAYTNARPDAFQLPARALGYRCVLDYARTQLGVQDSYEGMLQIEGAWYCPSIPEVLITASKDFDAHRIDEPTYRARLIERWRYAIASKAAPDAEGYARLRCPASNPAPVARCDLKPASVSADTRGRLRIPVRDDVATHPPRICSQQSVTVAPEAGAKYAQDLLYRSEAWEAMYGRLRNCVEGFNGFVKDGSREALDDPERRRIRGVAAQSVFVAFLLVAANLRRIKRFLAEQGAVRSGTLRRLPRRRRTRGLPAWRPEDVGDDRGVDPAVEPKPPPRSA